MFWALKGATRSPSLRKRRHNPATRMLLPTCDAVPWTISVLPTNHLGECRQQALLIGNRSHADPDTVSESKRRAIAHDTPVLEKGATQPRSVADGNQDEVCDTWVGTKTQSAETGFQMMARGGDRR